MFPNNDYDKKIGSKKFASVIINVKDRHIVNEGGVSSIPYKIGKYGEYPDSDMGYSPAVEILPDVKMVNAAQKTFIESCERAANPAIIYEDDGVVGQPVTSPGGAIVVRNGALVPTPLQSGANPQLTKEFIDGAKQVIRERFLNDVFDALTYYRRETAADLKEIEIRQKIEEGFVAIAPVIVTLQRDLLDPLILEVLNDIPDKELPPAPFEFEKKIIYQGRLALAMNSMQTNAIETVLAKWGVYDEAYNVFDTIDLDKAFKTSAINQGLRAELFRDEEEVNQIRQQRNMTQQMAMEAEIASNAAKAYKDVSNVPQDGSLASAL